MLTQASESTKSYCPDLWSGRFCQSRSAFDGSAKV